MLNCPLYQFWTYAVITLGFSLFFSGLVGWVGGASESPCLVRYVPIPYHAPTCTNMYKYHVPTGGFIDYFADFS